MFRPRKQIIVIVASFMVAACGEDTPTAGDETTLVPVANFRDLNGNGAMEPYEDDSLPMSERVADIITRMMLD